MSPAAWAEVEDVRLWASPDNTRVVFDADAPVYAEVFPLQNPNRVVIDLTRPVAKTLLADLDISSSPIKALRSGKHGNGTRIVFDLGVAVTPISFTLPPGPNSAQHRLVVDIPVAKSAPSPTSAEPLAQEESKTDHGLNVEDIVVVIDPGHGGKDPGAIGPAGTYEKDVVLPISQRLAARINQLPGFTAKLTRSDDRYIGLRRRTEIARELHADFFLSVHADAAQRRSARGGSIYGLSTRGATSENARWLANASNRAVIADDADFLALSEHDDFTRSALLDLSMGRSRTSAASAGKFMLKEMGGLGKLHKTYVEQANFAVLRSPDIPSLLVETGFLSNPQEEQKLKTPAHQEAIADALATGIKAFFMENPPTSEWAAVYKHGKSEKEREAPQAAHYVVKAGDSLYGIAREQGTSVTALRQHNDLEGTALSVGQTLILRRDDSS